MAINDKEKTQDTQIPADVTDTDANVQTAAGTQDVNRQEENDEVQQYLLPDEGGKPPQKNEDEELKDKEDVILTEKEHDGLPGQSVDGPLEEDDKEISGQLNKDDVDDGLKGQQVTTWTNHVESYP